jgi:flagellar basal body-associated protein FliL
MWLLLILTVIAVIGFIISGFMFIIGDTSGDKEKAKSWLTYSIIGVIVALIGYIVINLIDTILRGNVQQ